ncbi:MAG: hypothetical protein P8P29_04490 [Flavobacteriaceae bacterium]|nr:hypothetical protein [Flavobacteriaceae bacterium]
MKDYEDFRVWKEVDSYESHTLSKFDRLTPEEVFAVCSKLIKDAEAEGLENCSLSFKSQYEPYEDYLDHPTVSAKGYRKLNSAEKADREFEDEVRRIAEEKGILDYQARKLLELKRDGVID